MIGYKWKSVESNFDRASFETIENNAKLQSLIKSRKSTQFGEGQLIQVPVGFFIQSFSFVNANDVNFIGYIWIKYPKTYTDKRYKEEFIFPEEVYSNTTKTEHIYTDKKDDYLVKGWYFDVIVREKYDYSKYPLDFQTTWLRLWSKEFIHDEKIIFVPDFDSYVPEALAKMHFGLDKDIVPGGWILEKTFYSIKDQEYDTSFGLRKANQPRIYWEMYYNIGVKRSLVDALITDLVPLFFTTILLFALIVSASNEPTRKERFGFNTTNTIAICASLLFIVVLLHIQIRRQFVGSELVYIEYFYIITYLMILFTTLNSYAITVDRHKTLSFLFWRDNLLPKIAYWPFLLWMMAVITLIII